MNAAQFNALYEVGVPVLAYPGARPEDDANAERLVTRTRTVAQSSCSGHDVVWVEDHGAYISLTHIDVIGEGDLKALQLADAVAEMGALPMPVGPVASRLSPQREAEIVAARYTDRSLAAADVAIDDLRAELAAVRAELAARTEDVAFLERATLPELRRTVEHHQAGKQRWRERAVKAEAEAYQYRTALEASGRKAERDRVERDALKRRIDAVLDLCDREERNAARWENPIPVPEWVGPVQRAALGDDKRTEAAS